jgi:hypothetical protein
VVFTININIMLAIIAAVIGFIVRASGSGFDRNIDCDFCYNRRRGDLQPPPVIGAGASTVIPRS